jgi:hypothetical protein
MIKLEKIKVMNMPTAIRGMRNPMNSWELSDTKTSRDGVTTIGPKDMTLARRLVKAGSDERKFLRQIFVSLDITAPLYWWKEFDTYKVGTVANSTSTMHKITEKQFTRKDFSCDRMTPAALACLDGVIKVLEERRQAFVETKAPAAWDDIIQLLPTSYNQLRTVTLNYENLLNQYHARRNHKLQEWRTYCLEVYCLPYFRELCVDPFEN